ncbi:lebercilin isoform 1-T2 [Rhinophrynus dorsalis]
MNTSSPYSRYDSINKQTGQSPQSPRESTSTQTYVTKKGTHRKMKEKREMAMGDRVRTRSRHDPDQNRSSDEEKNSDSYYSDDYENTTYGSDRSPTPSSKSRSPHVKKLDHKLRSITPVQNRGLKKAVSKFSSSKKAPKWGFRSQSLNKESPPKDIDLVAKRVLSARLLKINELRNELTEHQIKLEELQKENKTLKRLQFRQEKALNKFEDTENEISQLISRHNNEIRTLREHLRKSQERERATEKRLKDTEDELYKTNNALKKLKLLSENRHLAEREELSKKVELLETKLEERERRVKDLEKNLELTQSSFQRQLVSEKKKVSDAQVESKLFQEELQRLTQKLKEKERELDTKNIYAFRLLKHSPKKDMEITPRKKVTSQRTSTGVQTNEPVSPVDLLPPPSPVFQAAKIEEDLNKALTMKSDDHEKELRKAAENLRKEKESAERKWEQEKKLQKEKEQKLLEDKAQKLREEWEKEEFERERKEDLSFHAKLEKEQNQNKTEEKNVNTEEEKLRKELLLAKMFEIDAENQDAFHFDPIKPPPQTPLLDLPLKPDAKETKHKIYKFSEPTEKLFNGLPVHGVREASSKADAPNRKNKEKVDSTADVFFGSYAPSFVKGKPSAQGPKNEVFNEPIIISNTKLNLQKEKKSNLMEQLFGSSSNTSLPSISKGNESTAFASGNNNANPDSNSILPWEVSRKVEVKNDSFLFGNGRSANSNRQRSEHTLGRPVVKAVDSLEEDIEEVAL